nr:glycosyltransferase [Nocardioides zeae]
MLPKQLENDLIRRRGLPQDLGAAVALACGAAPIRRALVQRRDFSIGRAVARQLRTNPDGVSGVLIPTGTACDLDQVVREHGLILAHYTPLPKASTVQTILKAERESNARWARHLGVGFTPDERTDSSETAGVPDCIIANSAFTARSFSGSSAQVINVPLAANYAERFNLPTSTERRRPGEKLRVAFSGQINQRKGISYLTEAIYGTLQDKVSLHLFGNDATGFVPELRRAYPGVQIEHTEKTDQESLWGHLSAMHAFAFPTLVDGFGNSLAEAAAIGLPSIVTDNCGARDIGLVPEAAVVVPPASVSAIVDAIEILLDEATRQDMGASARRIARQTRTWEQYGSEVTELLSELADRS